MTKRQQDNVVDLLQRQHQMIRKLFTKVEKAKGKARADAFDQLRCLLAVHETAEEEVVHPFARRTIGNGDRIINARLNEEREAKELLQELEKCGPDSVEFESMLGRLRKKVEAHAEHEEHVEFPELLAKSTPEMLKGMSVAVRAAEAIAPTHPHPGTESPLENLVAGPVAAVIDRTRDAIKRAT